jgi:galactokinase
MYRIVEGNTHGLNDVAEFIDFVNEPSLDLKDFFDSTTEIFIARAPGRLDVMGGIADYSGSLVLEMRIAEATLVAFQLSDEPTIKIISLCADTQQNLVFEMPLSQLETGVGSGDYSGIQEFFSRDRSNHWASYVTGVFFVLRRERGIDFSHGARILISSHVPIGKGVSSSAALEVATMQAVCAAFDIRTNPREMALLCQLVENSVVGAPCGVMDQITSHCSSEGSLISILCQPAEIRETVKIPKEIEFWGIDSGVRHAVAGSDYTTVRIGAFMGYRIIADLAGLSSKSIADGLVEIEDPRWCGYLCNVSPAEYENLFLSKIPETIRGIEFLKKYEGTTDSVTKIDPNEIYSVREPTEHGIYEHARVSAFSELLKTADDNMRMDRLGELMFQSHASYAACGLNEPGTDRIVELVRENRDRGLFGARITGGGSGGTVAILSRCDNESAIAEIARQYEHDTGRKPYIFHDSSPGAAAFGDVRLENPFG